MPVAADLSRTAGSSAAGPFHIPLSTVDYFVDHTIDCYMEHRELVGQVGQAEPVAAEHNHYTPRMDRLDRASDPD